jgi:hypothetical protein
MFLFLMRRQRFERTLLQKTELASSVPKRSEDQPRDAGELSSRSVPLRRKSPPWVALEQGRPLRLPPFRMLCGARNVHMKARRLLSLADGW